MWEIIKKILIKKACFHEWKLVKEAEMVDEMNRNKSFEEGAKWADKTMIEKACEWLKRHLYDYDYVEGFEVFKNVESFTKDFRKAMEK